MFVAVGRSQKHGHLFRRGRPLIRIPPLIASHDEVADWFFAIDPILDAFHVVIHPTKNDVVVVNRSTWTELALSRPSLLGVVHTMNPRSEQKMSMGILFSRSRSQQAA